jgi:AcrR family transcriptional regulator
MARTRSSTAHEKVLRAALDLFGEKGIDGTSMDAVANAAGVSKATIYNHWADKDALLMEVMLLVHGLDREAEEVDSGDLCQDLTMVLTRRNPDEYEVERERLTPSLIAYSALHPEFGKVWRSGFVQAPRRSLTRILRRGMDRGLLPADLDLELAMAILLGPIMYAHIFQKEAPADFDYIGSAVAEAFCRGFAVGQAELSRQSKTRRIRVSERSR